MVEFLALRFIFKVIPCLFTWVELNATCILFFKKRKQAQRVFLLTIIQQVFFYIIRITIQACFPLICILFTQTQLFSGYLRDMHIV